MANRSYLRPEDEFGDESAPYSSISSRGPIQDFTGMGDDPSPNDFLGSYARGPASAPNPAVKDAIKKRAQTVLKNPLVQKGDPAIDKAGRLNQDPLLQQFDESQDKLNSYREAKAGADAITNLGQAAASFAQGANTPQNNTALFANLQKQSASELEGAESDEQRRGKVLEAIEARQSKADENQKAREQRSFDASENRKSRAATLQASQDYKAGNQEMAINRTMGQVVSRINGDPIIKPSEQNLASLNKSKAILENTNVPLTSQSLSDAEQDIASALTLRGMGATEGKIKRTEIETMGRKLAEMKQKYTGQIVDLRKEQPELVNQIKKLNEALIDDYKTTIKDRYGKVYGDFEAAYGDDQRFLGRIDKMKQHALSGLAPTEKVAANPKNTANIGKMVKVQGKLYRVGSDGDSLEEVM